MTKEEAKQFGLSLLQGIADRNTDEYAENVRFAIKALSQPSLPANLDTAAEEYGKRQGTEEKLLAIKHFKAGVGYAEAQGVSLNGSITKNKYTKNHILHVDTTNEALKELEVGKVIIQIRKA